MECTGHLFDCETIGRFGEHRLDCRPNHSFSSVGFERNAEVTVLDAAGVDELVAARRKADHRDGACDRVHDGAVARMGDEQHGVRKHGGVRYPLADDGSAGALIWPGSSPGPSVTNVRTAKGASALIAC